MFWTYLAPKPKRDYIDPRIAIAKHIGWQKLPGRETYYSVPEPDNYNRAIITQHPIECTFVEDQVIYKNHKDNWITVMMIADEQQGEYDAWLNRLDVLAFWQHTNAPSVKNRRSQTL